MDGDNTMERCEEVTTATLRRVFAELQDQRVALEHMLLKPNMIVSGKKCSVQASVDDVSQLLVADQLTKCGAEHDQVLLMVNAPQQNTERSPPRVLADRANAPEAH